MTVKVGGVEVADFPYSVSGTFSELTALDAAYLTGASKVIVEDARPLDDLVVNAPLKDLASVVFAGGVKDEAANLLNGGAASAQLTTALGKHAGGKYHCHFNGRAHVGSSEHTPDCDGRLFQLDCHGRRARVGSRGPEGRRERIRHPHN